MGENTRQNCTRQNKKKNPGRQQPCWGFLFCTNLTQPTSGLDYARMQEVACCARELADEGRVVLVVTHDREFLQCACDRVLEL